MTDNRFGILLAISAGIVWSTIGLSIKSIEQANAFEILFYRSIFISVFIGTLLHFFFRFDFWDLFKNWVSYLIGGTSLFFAYIGGIYALLNYICSKRSSIVCMRSNIYSHFITNTS